MSIKLHVICVQRCLVTLAIAVVIERFISAFPFLFFFFLNLLFQAAPDITWRHGRGTAGRKGGGGVVSAVLARAQGDKIVPCTQQLERYLCDKGETGPD